MAFRQHMARPQPRLSFPASAPQQSQSAADIAPIASPLRKRTLEESEEWVLFTPVAESATTRTHTTSTDRTQTAGLSRLSDFGSLDTAARSDQQDEYDNQHTEHGSDKEEDDHDLDSLDDGLHAFHDEDAGDAGRRLAGSAQVLPTHDGLGSFPASSSLLQDQIRQFERTSPSRRHQRRRSSVQRRLDALEEQQEFHVDDEKMQRIERWRLEQSKALLEEIERETRRRRRRMSSGAAKNGKTRMDSFVDSEASSQATGEARQGPTDGPQQEDDSMSFLQRFTQRVIRDLMGIDESLLSVIFGEDLPEEAMSTTPTPKDITTSKLQKEMQQAIDSNEQSVLPDSWEHRLLERIARELGLLVHQLSEHPGAFSTYLRTQEQIPYAGLESSVSNIDNQTTTPSPSDTRRTSLPLSSSNAQFKPTLPATQYQHNSTYSEASLWGIEEEGPLSSAIPIASTTAAQQSARLQQEREYWERDLDAKMVCRFLLKRFSSDSIVPSSRAGPPSLNRNQTSHSSPANRAAIIRQHHPLLNRNNDGGVPTNPSSRRRDLLHRHHHNTAAIQPIRIRSGSSCASQSTKKSKCSRSGGSSRNYWDIGGSVGSGPGVGTWGEA